MAVDLNHTILSAHDSEASATFLAEILGLPAPTRFGPFLMVETANGVTLNFLDTDDEVTLSTTPSSSARWSSTRSSVASGERDLSYWADPAKTQPGEINTADGGRGLYFEDPDGHFLEIITRPYGSGG